MKTVSPVILGFAVSLLATACGGTGAATSAADEQVASDGAEATAASEQSTAVGSAAFESVQSQDPATAATQAAKPAAMFYPAGCVTRAKDPTNPLVVHVTFDECTGPFGLVHLNGGVTIAFSPGESGALHAAYAGDDLSANGHPLTFSASADITVSGGQRNVAWQGAWTATNAKGDTVSHTSDLTIVADLQTGCRTTNGTAVTHVATREIDTTFTDLGICHGSDGQEGCPTGDVDHTGKASGRSVEVAFDGSATAEVTGPGGNTFSVPLVCTPLTAAQ